MIEVLRSIRRTPYQSLAAFLILFFSLFLSTLMFILLTFLYGLLGYVESRPQVTVYFQSRITEKDIFKIRDELLNSGKIQSVKYISKDEAFKIYKQLNKDNPLLLEMVTADIFPASLEIYAKKPTYLPQIADFLKNKPGVDEVNFQRDIVDRLLTLTTLLRKISIILFIFLIFISILVLNTITLFKIALKKEEIELLKLLGATKFYIQKPFILESVFFGFFASLISYLIIFGMLYYLSPFLKNYFRGIPNLVLTTDFFKLTIWPININYLAITYFLSFSFAVGLAVFSTLLATQKYLKN